MSKRLEIQRILHERFKPEYLEVIDESLKHYGHSGYTEGDESHLKIIVSSGAVPGKNRLEKHREIHNALKDIIPGIHAIQIELK